MDFKPAEVGWSCFTHSIPYLNKIYLQNSASHIQFGHSVCWPIKGEVGKTFCSSYPLLSLFPSFTTHIYYIPLIHLKTNESDLFKCSRHPSGNIYRSGMDLDMHSKLNMAFAMMMVAAPWLITLKQSNSPSRKEGERRPGQLTGRREI